MNDIEFVTESNKIEGALREPTSLELAEHLRFVSLKRVVVEDLIRFVSIYQKGAVLRNKIGLNVRVGSHYPPNGGPEIVRKLKNLLDLANMGLTTPHTLHCDYEDLHPFTDGNGRSGRALWAWMMQKNGGYPLGFLHHFYYQTLERYEG